MNRDVNRCMVTDWKDYKHGGSTVVHAAHIIPEVASEISGKRVDGGVVCNAFLPLITVTMSLQISQPGGVMSTLSIFTEINIVEDLAGNRIHRLENIVSMNLYCHQLFDDLYLWLKPVWVRLPSPSPSCVSMLFDRVCQTHTMCV